MKPFYFLSRILLVLFLSQIMGAVSATEKDLISISGKVVQGRRQKPVGQASIQLSGINISTITNNDGIFVLKIPLNTPFTRLEIKHIGYANLVVSAENIDFNRQNQFVLRPETANSDSVDMHPVSAGFLIEQARKYIGRNYGKETLAKVAFFRESVKKGTRNISLSEVVFDIEKAPYLSFSPDLVRLYKGRRINNYQTGDTSLIKFKSGIISLMMMDMVKKRKVFLDESQRETYSYELEKAVCFDNRLHYVVSFSQNSVDDEELYKGKAYIDAENYAIARVEFSMNAADHTGAAQYFMLKDPAEVKVKVSEVSYIIDFRKIDGDHSLYYAKMEMKCRCKQKKKWSASKYRVCAEMVVTNEVDQHLVIRDNLLRVHAYDVLSEKIEDFENEAYWSGYNIIEPDKLVEKAIDKLVRASKSHSK